MIQWIQSRKWVPELVFGAFFALTLGITDYELQGTNGLITALLISSAFFFVREFSYISVAMVLIGSLSEISLGNLPTVSGFATAILVLTSAAFGSRLWSLLVMAATMVSGVAVAYNAAFSQSAFQQISGINVYNADGRFWMFLLASISVVGISGFAWLLGGFLMENYRQRRTKRERDIVQSINLKTMLEMAEQNQRFLIASDLNESVLQQISSMLTLTDGARYAARLEPEIAIRTLNRLAEIVRSVHEETRRLFDMLNRSVQVSAAPPNLNDLETLAVQLRAEGYPTKLTHSGARLELIPSAELAIYRIVFDAVQNVRQHAPVGTEIDVDFSWSEAGLQVIVKDNGIEVAASASNGTIDGITSIDEDLDALTREASGPGITGMRERARLFGGNIEAHRVPGVGFTVNALFPGVHEYLDDRAS